MTTRTTKGFNVTNVPVCRDRLTTITHREAFEKLVDGPLEALCNPDIQTVEGHGFHPFFEAAHQAFAKHYPLKFKPDSIFVLVNQGFATAVNANPEAYRKHFVDHKGKETISVYRPDFTVGDPRNNWPSCFGDFSSQIKTRIGDKNHGRFTAEFSTTGDVSRVVSQIVLMDVVQSYFSYVVFTDCGIPRIELDGTTADWVKLRDHVKGLKDYGPDLNWWLDKLLPIMDQFVEASKGNVDVAHWENMYKYFGMSGSHSIDGWLANFVPFVKTWGKQEKNPILTGKGDSIQASQLPSGLSTVPFDFDGAAYQFIGGHSAVIQEADGTVRPGFGWAVRPAPAAPVNPLDDADATLETVAG